MANDEILQPDDDGVFRPDRWGPPRPSLLAPKEEREAWEAEHREFLRRVIKGPTDDPDAWCRAKEELDRLTHGNEDDGIEWGR